MWQLHHREPRFPDEPTVYVTNEPGRVVWTGASVREAFRFLTSRNKEGVRIALGDVDTLAALLADETGPLPPEPPPHHYERR